MPQGDASPKARERAGLRSGSSAQAPPAPEGEDVVSSLRATIRTATERLLAYQARKEKLESEWGKMLEDHSAETARKMVEWGRAGAADFDASIAEGELQSRNAVFKQLENSASSQQQANLRHFEWDMESILRAAVAEDGHIVLDENAASDGATHGEAQPAASTIVRASTAFGGGVPTVTTPITRKRARESDFSRMDTDMESPGAKKSRSTGGPVSTSQGPRTVTYEEVYQGGNARHKHAIFSYPQGLAGKWYIVKCECADHTVYFGGLQGALRGAAKHLQGRSHGMEGSYSAAVEHLGWEVLGCNRTKATANNAALEKAIREGYLPINTLIKTASRNPALESAKREDDSPSHTPPPPARTLLRSNGGDLSPSQSPTRQPGTAITQAKGGELYYAYWPPDSQYYLCMVIPWDDTKGFGLLELYRGISGLGLLDKRQTRVPACYTVETRAKTRVITGWSEGYEDGGPKESKRFFPTLFFHPPKNLAAWTKASALQEFDWRKPKFGVPGYNLDRGYVDLALMAFSRARGFTCFADFKKSQEAAGVSGQSAELLGMEENYVKSRQGSVLTSRGGLATSMTQVNDDAADSPLTEPPTSMSEMDGFSPPAADLGQLKTYGDPMTGVESTDSPAEDGSDAATPVNQEPSMSGRLAAEDREDGPTEGGTISVATSPRTSPRPVRSQAPLKPTNTPSPPNPQPKVNVQPKPAPASNATVGIRPALADPSAKTGPPTQPALIADSSPVTSAPADARTDVVKEPVKAGSTAWPAPITNSSPATDTAADARPGVMKPPATDKMTAQPTPSRDPSPAMTKFPGDSRPNVINSPTKTALSVQPAAIRTPIPTERPAAAVTTVKPSTAKDKAGQMRGLQQPSLPLTPPTATKPPARDEPPAAAAPIINPSPAMDKPDQMRRPQQPPLPPRPLPAMHTPVRLEPGQPAAILKSPPVMNTPTPIGPHVAEAIATKPRLTVDSPGQIRAPSQPAVISKPLLPATDTPIRMQPRRAPGVVNSATAMNTPSCMKPPTAEAAVVEPRLPVDNSKTRGHAQPTLAPKPPPAMAPPTMGTLVQTLPRQPSAGPNLPPGLNGPPTYTRPSTEHSQTPSPRQATIAPGQVRGPQPTLMSNTLPTTNTPRHFAQPHLAANIKPPPHLNISTLPPVSSNTSFGSPSTPRGSTVKAEPIQYYYLSECEGPDGRWKAATDSDRLVLEVDTEAQTVRPTPDQPLSFVINRNQIAFHSQFRDVPEPGKHSLILLIGGGDTGGTRQQRFVFHHGEGMPASRQARRFWAWADGM